MDAQVLKAQKWVNAMYASVAGYVRCAEDGITGWGTMHSLTRALQVELGITALSDAFGPTTEAKLTALGPITRTNGKVNIRKIAESALYAKGYNGGPIDGAFGDTATTGLNLMQQDMGFENAEFGGKLTPKMFKGLLTMDAYKLLVGGAEKVRTVQKWLNYTHTRRSASYVVPCDGYFSRDVQTALVLAVQYQIGMADGVANGTFGPGTRDGVRAEGTVSTGVSGAWVRLFKAALIVNGYDDTFDQSFTAATATLVRSFQTFAVLPRTGAGDYQTWCSLLVSTGDTDRRGKAMDCRTPFDAARAAAVRAAGYETVGRYLTGAADKTLTKAEFPVIFGAGLTMFPIYQAAGNKLEYFSNALGKDAARLACAAARSYGLPAGTVIYFAVDYDATGDEITSSIIPHFQGVRDGVAADGNRFAVGIYGSRNVCGKVSAAALATRSFVSGMSAGFSGNLGFPLPSNWAFDQIGGLTVGAGTAGQVAIDNDIKSGRDQGVSSLTAPKDPNAAFYAYVVWIEARAQEWWDKGHRDRPRTDLVAQWLRNRNGLYSGSEYAFVSGAIDDDWMAYVRGSAGRPDDVPLRDPWNFFDSDVDHFGASFTAVTKHGMVTDRTQVNLADLGGWAGDLITTLAEFWTSGLPATQAYAFAYPRIAARNGVGAFPVGDFIGDVDAFVMALKAKADPTLKLSTILRTTFVSAATGKARYTEYYRQRFSSTPATLLAAGRSVFFQGTAVFSDFATYRAGLFARNTGGHLVGDVPTAARDAVALAFRDAVLMFT